MTAQESEPETLELEQGDKLVWGSRKTPVEVAAVGGQNILARLEGNGGPYSAERVAGRRFRVWDATDPDDSGTVRELQRYDE